MGRVRKQPRLIKRPKSLTEIATDQIREEIVSGELALGEMLSESGLAGSLGISKTPVREALVRLANEGLVNIVPQKGSFVFTVTGKELADMCTVRTALEFTALKVSFQNAPGELAAGLGAITSDMAEALDNGDIAAYLKLDTRFHREFFDHSDNDYLVGAYRIIYAKMAALRIRLGTAPSHVEKSYREHVQIAEAIAHDRLQQALEILEGHISQHAGSYWEELERKLLSQKARPAG